MSAEVRIKRLTILVLILAVVWWMADTIIYLNEKSAHIAAYKQYCPMNCPNTLWICTEGEIYFASDENGRVLGAAKEDGEIGCFGISFTWETMGFNIWELENISYPHIESCPFCFRGKASYTKDSCTLVYSAANDKEHYFGDRKGEVTLTFIKSDLTAPFSFSNEASLNELPFR